MIDTHFQNNLSGLAVSVYALRAVGPGSNPVMFDFVFVVVKMLIMFVLTSKRYFVNLKHFCSNYKENRSNKTRFLRIGRISIE